MEVIMKKFAFTALTVLGLALGGLSIGTAGTAFAVAPGHAGYVASHGGGEG
jgi:hypothetical protein